MYFFPSPYFFSFLLLRTLSASSLLFQPPPSPYSFSLLLLPTLLASSFNVFLLLLLPSCSFTLLSLLPILLPFFPSPPSFFSSTIFFTFPFSPSSLHSPHLLPFSSPPPSFSLSPLFSPLRFKSARVTDQRVRVMNEVISGIRVIKMYAWEHAFRKVVSKLRRYGVQLYFIF